MKSLFVFLAMISGTVMASNYECVTKENVVVSVSPMEVGGMVSLRDQYGVVSEIGKIELIETYGREDEETSLMFEILLAAMEESEVTELTSADFRKVTSMVISMTEESDGVVILRLFAEEKEVAGALVSDQDETSCKVK